MNNELYHHGILGMKWGVRRYQNPDGSLTELGKKRNEKYLPEKNHLDKGTRIYRTTSDKNETLTGPKYVTFNKTDRAYYNSSDGRRYVEFSSGTKKLYEKQYVADKDLTIATSKYILDSVEKLSKKDKKFKESCLQGYIEFRMKKPFGLDDDMMNSLFKNGKLTEKETDRLLSTHWGKDWKSDMSEDKVKTLLEYHGKRVEDTYKGLKWKSGRLINSDKPEDRLIGYLEGLTTERGSYAKTKLTNQLVKNGYDAMSDIAGIGGAGGYTRETIQSLIILNSEKSLKEIRTEPLTGAKAFIKEVITNSENEYLYWKAKTSAYSKLDVR